MDDEDFIPLDQVPAYIDGLIQKSEVLAAQNERLRGDMDARFKTIDRLSDDLKALREQNRVLASLLAKAQPHVCSALCPSVKRDGDLWTHKDLCAHMEAALTATSPEGQHD